MRKIKAFKNIKYILVALLLANISTLQASALRGIKEVGILIEVLHEDAVKCGITKGMIDAAIRVPLSNSKLRITERLNSGVVYADVNTILIQNTCAVSLRLSYLKFVASENDSGQFWNRSMLLLHSRHEIVMKTSNQLELYTKEFISEWLRVGMR